MHMITGSSYTALAEVDVDSRLEYYESALSIAQLVSFKTVQKRGGSNDQFCHNAEKETPLNIYIAFLLHSHTRSRTLVDKFYHLGVCISNDCMLTWSTNLGNSSCAQFEEDGIVCPASLHLNIFSTFAVDNLNPSSRTATNSWHETAISATQHINSAHDGIQWPPRNLKKVQGNLNINFHMLILLSIHLFWNQVTCSFLRRSSWMNLKTHV